MRCGEDQVFFTGYYSETRDVFFNIISRGLSITCYTISEFSWRYEFFSKMPRELCKEYLTAVFHHRLHGHSHVKFGVL